MALNQERFFGKDAGSINVFLEHIHTLFSQYISPMPLFMKTRPPLQLPKVLVKEPPLNPTHFLDRMLILPSVNLWLQALVIHSSLLA